MVASAGKSSTSSGVILIDPENHLGDFGDDHWDSTSFLL
jgi:hypothetical protein